MLDPRGCHITLIYLNYSYNISYKIFKNFTFKTVHRHLVRVFRCVLGPTCVQIESFMNSLNLLASRVDNLAYNCQMAPGVIYRHSTAL